MALNTEVLSPVVRHILTIVNITLGYQNGVNQNADGSLVDVYVPDSNVPAAPACGIELDFLTV